MGQDSDSSVSGKRRARLQCFRPVFWWLVASIFLLLIDWHLRALDRTILQFAVSIEGQRVTPGRYRVTADGRTIQNGGKIPLGWCDIEIQGEGTEVFTTNMFVWYGPHHLGRIDLAFSRGTLELTFDPPASSFTLKGDHATIEREQSTGETMQLPTGEYTLQANFGDHTERETIHVRRDARIQHQVEVNLGGVTVESDPAGARFQMNPLSEKGRRFTGTTPQHFEYVPAIGYQIEMWHDAYRLTNVVHLESVPTNRIHYVFAYGAAQVTTEPEGFEVREGRRVIGVTPLMVTNLPPGEHVFRLGMRDYQTTNVTVNIRSNETTEVHFELVRRDFLSAMQQAQRYLDRSSPDYQRALRMVEAASEAEPDEPAAQELKAQIQYDMAMAEAQTAASDRNAAKALAALDRALRIRPNDSEALELRQSVLAAGSDWNRERLSRNARTQFEQLVQQIEHYRFFETHEWRVDASLGAVQNAVLQTMPKCEPTWQPEGVRSLGEGMFTVQGRHREFLKPDKHCLILVTALGENECLVLGRFWDFVLGIGTTRGNRNALTTGPIPVHPQTYKPDNPQEAEARRRAIAESFINQLRQEIQP